METQTTIIQDAIDDLDHFGGQLTREVAARLLTMWVRRREFGPGDLEQVLDHYPLADTHGWISGPGGAS